MAKYEVYYIGTEAEAAHHAAPLQREIDVKLVSPKDAVRLARPNDLAIFFSEHFHRFREAWHGLSQKGCNTLYAIDGILEWRNAWENRPEEPACPWTMRPVLSDKVACIGASQSRILDAWGNRGKTEVVGLPRLDAHAIPRKTVQAKGEFRVLITTAKWPGFTAEQVEKAVHSLIDVKQQIESVGKFHGRKIVPIWRLTGDLEKQVGVQNQLSDVTGKELAEVLPAIDAVITTPSTVMLEAMLRDVPLCLLDYTNSPGYVEAAWTITGKDQIVPILSQLVCPSSRRMFLQRQQLNDTLQCAENATQRMARLINEMIRIGHDCRAANQEVVFPTRILSDADSGLVLDLASEFPAIADQLRTSSNLSHQVVAAEALRRVNHLQDRINLLEHELERAAEGFDRIASHPILAPLLKVRKIAIGMGVRISDLLKVDTELENDSSPDSKVKAGS